MRDAIALANARTSDVTISFDPNVFPANGSQIISLLEGQLNVHNTHAKITIIGPAARALRLVLVGGPVKARPSDVGPRSTLEKLTTESGSKLSKIDYGGCRRGLLQGGGAQVGEQVLQYGDLAGLVRLHDLGEFADLTGGVLRQHPFDHVEAA